jgi:hypothetical protein
MNEGIFLKIGHGVGGPVERAFPILGGQYGVADLTQQLVQDAEIGQGIVHHQDDWSRVGHIEVCIRRGRSYSFSPKRLSKNSYYLRALVHK